MMAKSALLAPPPLDPSAEFDVERAMGRLERILGDERPHPVDTDANDAVRDRLLGEIRAIGYEPQLRDDFACRQAARLASIACARVRNILFRAGPSGGDAIMVASHYDSVAAGPGAADDGAGVAAALEIASILKGRRSVKPVLFLITDGEEPGLIGAASFVRTDFEGRRVGAVINMEARGVSGPALMFQTSAPNGRDIAAFADLTKRPFANSLATDIYRRMPNDTDLTEFLKEDPDAANLAFIGRSAFYHTPFDNLANLDRRSLAHLGSTALSTLDGYLKAEPKGAEGRVIFSDVFGRSLVVLPEIAGLLLSLFGLGAAAYAYWRSGEERAWRVAAAPLAGAVIAGALGVAALTAIGVLRDETYFWFASPYATRAVVYLAGVAGAVIAFLYAARQERRRATLAASWFWFSAIGVVAALAMPGAAILFAVPAALFGCAVVAAAGAPRLLPVFALAGAAAAFAFILPALDLAEQALGLEAGWALSIIGALVAALVLPLAPGVVARRTHVATGILSAFVAASALALTAPAYAPSAPRPLNIQHVVNAASGEAHFSLSPAGEKAPRPMASVATFRRRAIDGLDGERVAAPAPAHDGVAVGVSILRSAAAVGGRELTVQLAANGADEFIVAVPAEAALRDVIIGGVRYAFDDGGERTVRCSGRACATLLLRARLGEAKAAWTFYGVRRGLGPEAKAIRDARPAFATPIHGGDVRLVISQQEI